MLHLDDDTPHREWVRAQLTRLAGDVAILEADSLDRAVQLLQDGSIDCLLSNDQIPGDEGRRLLERLRKAGDSTPFIMLSDRFGGEATVVGKGILLDDGCTAVVAFGDVDQINHWMRRLVESSARPAELEKLTSREEEVLRLIGRGLSNKEIAAELGISYNTVVNHVRNTFAKLGIHSRAEAICLVHRIDTAEDR